MKLNLLKNKILFWLGFIHLLIFITLFNYSFFNEVVVLGINSMVKPMKFALSIWIYSWTMALILNYVTDNRKVEIYSLVAFICMGFEQIAITLQALRGELSHFNISDTFGIILFALMGVFILIITLWTAYITYIFSRQNTYELNEAIVLSIKIGLIFFVVFSLFGGYISSLQGHTVGASDGEKGLWFLNWNTHFGDLRVAHFFGIHSLQIIPLFTLLTSKWFDNSKSINAVKIFSFIYFTFILWTLVQGLLGLPFIKS
jgi:hypothetical protein